MIVVLSATTTDECTCMYMYLLADGDLQSDQEAPQCRVRRLVPETRRCGSRSESAVGRREAAYSSVAAVRPHLLQHHRYSILRCGAHAFICSICSSYRTRTCTCAPSTVLRVRRCSLSETRPAQRSIWSQRHLSSWEPSHSEACSTRSREA